MNAQFVYPWSSNFFVTNDVTTDIWRSGNIVLFNNQTEGLVNKGLLFSSADDGLDAHRWKTPYYGITPADRNQLRLSYNNDNSWRSNPLVMSGHAGLALRSENASVLMHQNGIVSIGLNNVLQNATIQQLSTKPYNGYWGEVSSGYMLYVRQGIVTEKVKIAQMSSWPDYVLKKDYVLLPLSKVEAHIAQTGHLPNVPSAATIEKEGMELGDMAKRQQEKIEELFLHLIEMDKRLQATDISSDLMRMVIFKLDTTF